jgi:hypothetical protein
MMSRLWKCFRLGCAACAWVLMAFGAMVILIPILCLIVVIDS